MATPVTTCQVSLNFITSLLFAFATGTLGSNCHTPVGITPESRMCFDILDLSLSAFSGRVVSVVKIHR